MDSEGVGLILFVGWLLVLAVAWVRAKMSGAASLMEFVPWWTSMLGAFGLFLALDFWDGGWIWLAFSVICLGYGILKILERLHVHYGGPRPEPTAEEAAAMEERAERLVAALTREPDAMSQRELQAGSLKYAIGLTALFTVITIGVAVWLRGTALVAAALLPGIFAVAFGCVTIGTWFKIVRLDRRIAAQAEELEPHAE